MKHTMQQCRIKLEGIRVVLKQAEAVCRQHDPQHRIQSALQMVDELLREDK